MSPLPRLVVSTHSGNSHQSGTHHLTAVDTNAATMDENLHMFREALAISGNSSAITLVRIEEEVCIGGVSTRAV